MADEEPIPDIFEDDLAHLGPWDEAIMVSKDLIQFRRPNMQTLAGQEAMRRGEYYKRIKKSIQSQGIINPLVCIEERGKYIICLGHKRYLAGLELGLTQFPVLIAETGDKGELLEIRRGYKPASSDTKPPI